MAAVYPSARPSRPPSTDRRLVTAWLSLVLLAIVALVLVGGATRLTDSGLSITEWKPVHGVVPPLSAEEWEEEFALYRQIPEYRELKQGMSLDDFKTIFWWEWAHRLLARGVGVLFAVPLAVLWFTGRIGREMRWPLLGIFALGGLQGAVGWWMVASGLVERTDVSQYRLATHLTIACLIFAAIVWVLRSLGRPDRDDPPTKASMLAAGLIVLLVLMQIYLGGLVAGLDAGLAYNTWPLMDGSLVPGDLGILDPLWRNLFENPKTAQFAHRMTAYALWLAVAAHWLVSISHAPGSTHARRAALFFLVVSAQAAIGIVTLVMQVPLHAALLHQAGALAVLGFAVWHWRSLAGAKGIAAAQA